ncbi:hypothetical protein Prudu_011033, partial [Prunus dulcis]
DREEEDPYIDDGGAICVGVHGSCGVPSRRQFLLPPPYPSPCSSISQFSGIWVVDKQTKV